MADQGASSTLAFAVKEERVPTQTRTDSVNARVMVPSVGAS